MGTATIRQPVTGVSVDPLRERVRGRVLTADDEGYDEARAVHNGMFNKRPLAVLRAEQVADVIAGVNFARDNGLDLSIRDGGHSAPGFGTNDDGLVIDMSPMRTVLVDPRNKTARAGAGATWGDFNHATHAFGLATTGGIISTTGITGLTLGGGIGYLARACGLSVDNLISADVVTADGKFVTASAHENEDLFWALRGAQHPAAACQTCRYERRAPRHRLRRRPRAPGPARAREATRHSPRLPAARQLWFPSPSPIPSPSEWAEVLALRLRADRRRLRRPAPCPLADRPGCRSWPCPRRPSLGWVLGERRFGVTGLASGGLPSPERPCFASHQVSPTLALVGEPGIGKATSSASRRAPR